LQVPAYHRHLVTLQYCKKGTANSRITWQESIFISLSVTAAGLFLPQDWRQQYHYRPSIFYCYTFAGLLEFNINALRLSSKFRSDNFEFQSGM